LFDDLPRINQRREVETDDATCSLIRIVVLNYGANNSLLNFTAVQCRCYRLLALAASSVHSGSDPDRAIPGAARILAQPAAIKNGNPRNPRQFMVHRHSEGQ